MPERKTRKGKFWATLAGGAVVAAVGIGLIYFPSLGGGLARLSYDLPFVFRSQIPDELVMVYIDSKVKANLRAPIDQPLDLRYHTQLLEKLKQDGARLVLYDVLFDEPNQEPEVNKQFAEALRDHGSVVLVADYVKQVQGNVFMESPVPPTEVLATNAAGWGLARIALDRGDAAVRLLDPGAEAYPSASWVAARLLKAPAAEDERERFHPRWLNYYGPPSSFRWVNLDQALMENGLPRGFFRNKLVVVGTRPTVGVAEAQQDSFATPYSRLGKQDSFWWRSSGAEIHAVSLLNLLHGDWLEQLSTHLQLGLVLLWGLVAGAGLMLVRPWHAAWLAGTAVLLLFAAVVYLQFYRNIWWPWLVPAAAQTPVALVWSVGWQYALELRRRKRLRRAFAGYLSPHLADRIAEGEFDLSLGGKVVEATVMFTDLDGFTALSENLNPDEVSRILTTYFNQTTRGILEQEGTIIKYMGDAVMAVWGAPLPDPKQAERAVIAAWGMIQTGREEIAGRSLRTRIGINSGPVLAGNLGSDFRFDYAAIGDTTNTASRLESLNKQLATDILIAEATRQQLSRRIRTRALGRFRMAGKIQPVAIHEVLGVDPQPAEDLPWLSLFDEALRNFTGRKLDEAEKLLARVIELRGGQDGPSDFYLKQIIAARRNPPTGESWDGVAVISSK